MRSYVMAMKMTNPQAGLLADLLLLNAQMVDRAAAADAPRLILAGARSILYLFDRVDALQKPG